MKLALIRRDEFHGASGGADCLEQPVPLVDLFLGKQQDQIIRQLFHVIRQLIAFILEKSRILQQDHPVLRKEGQGLTQVDHFPDRDILAGIPGKVHGFSLRDQSPYKKVPVLSDQIFFFPVEKIGRFKTARIQIGSDTFHLCSSSSLCRIKYRTMSLWSSSISVPFPKSPALVSR